MPWTSLGTVSVGDDWQSFPEDCLGYETFRLNHTTIVDPFNQAFLSRYFPAPGDGGRFAPWRRIYPSSEPVIIQLPIPEILVAQGIAVFTMQVRRKFPYYPVPWTIHLEALI